MFSAAKYLASVACAPPAHARAWRTDRQADGREGWVAARVVIFENLMNHWFYQ